MWKVCSDLGDGLTADSKASAFCPRTMTRSGTPHDQDRHAMQPDSCHCSPRAKSEMDRPELKLDTMKEPGPPRKVHLGAYFQPQVYPFQETPAMFYLAIDQHKRQLTVNLRSEDGTVVLKRQVSTQWEKVRPSLPNLPKRRSRKAASSPIVEVCGMNDWLVKMLREHGCREIVVIQPTERSKQKTDRRDAGELAHLLWIHRQQFLDGKHPLGLRRVQPPTPQEAADRQLSMLRAVLTRKRTAVLNGIHKLLRKHNLEQAQPAKGFQTKKVRKWLEAVELPPAGPPGVEPAAAAMGLVQRAVEDRGREDRRAGRKRRAGAAPGNGAGAWPLPRLGHQFADRQRAAFQACRQPGELLRPDARLPQFGRSQPASGLDHRPRPGEDREKEGPGAEGREGRAEPLQARRTDGPSCEARLQQGQGASVEAAERHDEVIAQASCIQSAPSQKSELGRFRLHATLLCRGGVRPIIQRRTVNHADHRRGPKMRKRVSTDSIAFLVTATILLGSLTFQPLQAEPAQGMYFAKKQYVPKPLPTFAETKGKLPSPIYDENPLYVQMYWKTWELGFRNFYEPKPGSGFVSQFIDAAFNENIFLWDTCFLTMFCNYGHPLVPGIGSLDNFYAKQYEDGEICREINRTTGRDYVEWVNREQKDLFSRWSHFSVTYAGRDVPKPPPHLTLDALNHPIFAWAELESVRVTGDRSRLKLVYEPLVRYYRALQKYIRQGNGLYMTDWASMDNSPRNPYLEKGGTAVDTSSQMVLFGNQLAEIADLLGKKDEAVGVPQGSGRTGSDHQRQDVEPQAEVLLRPDGRWQAGSSEDHRRLLDAPGGRGVARAGRRPGSRTAESPEFWTEASRAKHSRRSGGL